MKLSAGFRRRGIMSAAAAAATAAVIGLAVPAVAAQATARGAGQTGSPAAVPWTKVGPGWSLAQYSASQGGEGKEAMAGPMSLYLVDPSGGKYRLFTWSAHSRQAQWHLLAWSGDVRRALFEQAGVGPVPYRQRVIQLQLSTGATTNFLLPAQVFPIGYTRPAGLALLAQKGGAISSQDKVSLQRYSLTGQLEKTLITVTGPAGNYLTMSAYQPSGTELAVGSARGLKVISNAGGVVRNLAVPGVRDGCSAVRWWDASTILASCSAPGANGPRMWLVPASGVRPTALTPARTGGFDLGDFNAWRVSGGLYVDGYGPCATLVIGRQPAHGRERQIRVPGQDSSSIVTATRSSLQVVGTGCDGGASLVWFSPVTRSTKVVIPVGPHQYGVVSAVPYFVTGKF